MTELQIIIAVFLAYLALLAGLALWSKKAAINPAGYFIADKKLPYWVVAFSANATGESGWLLLGLTGMAYVVGVHALWVSVGEVMGVALSWCLIAGKLKRRSDKCGAITLPDYLASEFDDKKQYLRLCSVLIIMVMVLAYVAAQMVAAGKAFSDFMQISYVSGVILGAAVTLLYTIIGGYKAVAYTDLVQGVLMLLALVILPAVAIHEAGGFSSLLASLRHEDAALLSITGPHGFSLAGGIAVASFLAIGLPFLGVPQFLVRYMSIVDAEQIPKAAAMSITCAVCFSFGAVLTGLAGRILFPGLADAELIMPTLSRELFPPLITAILVIVLLAAIMSTVDSLLILLSSAVTCDLLERIIAPGLSSAALSTIGKLVTLAVGIAAVLIALTENRTIFWFVLFSWSGLGSAFGPLILSILFWRGVTLPGALAGMLGGFLTTVIWSVSIKPHALDMYEAIPGFLVSFLLIVMVSKLTAAKPAV